jgi:hypothetical protein
MRMFVKASKSWHERDGMAITDDCDDEENQQQTLTTTV